MPPVCLGETTTHRMTPRVLPALALAALLGAGCSGASETAPMATPGAAPSTAPAPEASGAADDLEALYWQRIQASRTYTQADVDYMTGMIGHHAQALVMADLAMRNDASPAVKRLAARIDNAQRDEIETMQRWLRQRGQPVPVPVVEGTVLTLAMEAPEASGARTGGGAEGGNGDMGHEGMGHAEHASGEMDHAGMDHSAMGHGMHHGHAGMPGMLTQAQLDELAAARGPAFDRLFLTYMIAHHGGAVVMTEDLFSQDGAAQDDTAFKLASDIQVDQRTEIARMQRMLDALPGLDYAPRDPAAPRRG